MNIGFINQNVSPRLNMGLAYIMTVVAQKHQVFLWDIVGRYKNFSSYLNKQIKKVDPQVIGFSVNSYTFRSALYWAEFIRKEFPHIVLIFGGVHPTIRPIECLNNPFVDIVCVGEGEYSITECLDCLENGEPPYRVSGIWYKDTQGNIVKNTLRPFVEELDTLPFPDWDIWDIELYIKSGGLVRNSLKILSSRGCYYDCKFCTAPIIRRRIPGQYYRVRSAENVIAEIKRNVSKYHDIGFNYLSFADPLFGADNNQFNSLLELYRKEGLSSVLPWICETRPEVVTPKWARNARRAGCIVVSLGIESGDDSMRRIKLGKTSGSDDIHSAVSNLKRNDIMYILYFILGAPGEDLRSFRATLKLSKVLNPVKAYFLFFLPLPETPLFHECKGFLLKHRDSRYDDGFWNRPNIKLDNVGILGYLWMRIQLFMLKLTVFLKNGWKLRKFIFLKDIIRYVKGENRILGFLNPYARNELYQNTVLKYFLEDKRKKMLAGN